MMGEVDTRQGVVMRRCPVWCPDDFGLLISEPKPSSCSGFPPAMMANIFADRDVRYKKQGTNPSGEGHLPRGTLYLYRQSAKEKSISCSSPKQRDCVIWVQKPDLTEPYAHRTHAQ